MSEYHVESSETVYDGVLSRARMDRVRMPDGHTRAREVMEHVPAVAVVAVDQGCVVLVRQYRHPLREWLLEVPAGLLDIEGEAPDDAARRELIEEVGLEPGRLDELVTFANSAGWTDERTTVYLATDLRPASPPDDFSADAEEAGMQVVRMRLDEAVARARRGDLCDAKTVIGLLLAQARLQAAGRRDATAE
ncbi:MAG: NUDIX hydrolase [Actinobacteria bacterium]|nr:NUDIX hydrolase [Actinomycetota bacterium]